MFPFAPTDCCDGSDEYSSGAKCPDICEQVGREAKKEYEERIRTIEAGARKKKEYIQQAEQALREKRDTLKSLQSQLDSARARLEEAEAKQAEVEATEKDRASAGVSERLDGTIAGLRLNELE
ncbi:Prkcsh, partial [Symbiodinium sp. KB8]